MDTKAIAFVAPNEVALVDTQVPDPVGTQLLMQTLFTAVSPGTELRNLSGKMPGITFPCVPGYLSVGRVIGRGPAAGEWVKDGTLVFVPGTHAAAMDRYWGGHIGHSVSNDVYVLPEGVEPVDAVVVKLAAIAYQGVRLSRPTPEDTAAVVGLGPIGHLSLQLHQLHGCRAVGFDLSPQRVAIARAAGCEAHVIHESLRETAGQLQQRGFDIVVDATGSTAVLRDSIAILRDRPWQEPPLVPGVRLVIQGSYPGDLSFNYMQLFQKGATVHVPRDCQSVDIEACLRLMQRRRLNVRPLGTEVASPADAPRVYAQLAGAKGAAMTVAFDRGKLRGS